MGKQEKAASLTVKIAVRQIDKGGVKRLRGKG
jgi:hypothetical protein